MLWLLIEQSQSGDLRQAQRQLDLTNRRALLKSFDCVCHGSFRSG
jgi:hypothetical protein